MSCRNSIFFSQQSAETVFFSPAEQAPRWEGAEDACMIFIPAEKPKSLPNDDGGGVIIPVKLTFESTARSFFKL